MQVLLLTLTILLLIFGSCLDKVLMELKLNKLFALLYLAALCFSALFPWQLQAGKVSVQPVTLMLLLSAAAYFFFQTPKGWGRYKAVLCGCLCFVAVYFCALYFAEYTDEILQEKTIFAALMICALAFVLCADITSAMCAACLGAMLSVSALHAVHFVLFFDVLCIGFSPMTLCFLYCMLFIPVLFAATDALQHIVDRRKHVHS